MGLIYTQPQGFAQIDWGNPITRGILGEINAASPGIGAAYVGGANSTVVTPMGLAHAGNGSRFIWKDSQPIGSAATILLISNVRNKSDGTNIFGGIGTTTAGNQFFAFQGPQSGASFRAVIRLANGGGFTSRESASIPSAGADITDLSVWCAVYDGTTNLRLYRDGVDDSGTNINTAASGAATGLNCFSLGGINRGTDSFAVSGQNQALIVPWNRALSVDEAKSITANPWQIFKSQSRRIFVASAGGAAALASNAAAQASASAAATTAIPITAAALSIASASGALSTAIPLSGVAASVASGSGALTAQVRLSADALAQAVSAAALSSGIILTAAAVAQAAAAGTLSSAIQLIANAAAQASAPASLTAGSSGLAANAQASASASAALTIQIQLSAAALAQATASASLTAASSGLSATASASASAQGDITTQIKLNAAALAEAIAVGGLTARIDLTANAITTADASAWLLTAVQLAADASVISTAEAALTGGSLSVVRYQALTVDVFPIELTVDVFPIILTADVF